MTPLKLWLLSLSVPAAAALGLLIAALGFAPDAAYGGGAYPLTVLGCAPLAYAAFRLSRELVWAARSGAVSRLALLSFLPALYVAATSVSRLYLASYFADGIGLHLDVLIAGSALYAGAAWSAALGLLLLLSVLARRVRAPR